MLSLTPSAFEVIGIDADSLPRRPDPLLASLNLDRARIVANPLAILGSAACRRPPMAKTHHQASGARNGAAPNSAARSIALTGLLATIASAVRALTRRAS